MSVILVCAHTSSFYICPQFEYLGHCAGLELVTDSCLVTKTINNIMSIHTTNRLLQASSGVNVECSRPEVPEQAFRAFMSEAKDQCTELGSDITEEEFVEVVGTFMQLFANEECWVSLCAGVPSSVSSKETPLITSQDSRKHLIATSFLVAAGSAVAIALLIAGFYVRRNIRKEAAQDIFGQKYIDGSDGDESSYTTDLTCATGGDRTLLPSFVWQGSVLSVDLDTLFEEQSVDCSSCLDEERCEGGSLVYSTTSGENVD